MKTKQSIAITVGELKAILNTYPDDHLVSLSDSAGYNCQLSIHVSEDWIMTQEAPDEFEYKDISSNG